MEFKIKKNNQLGDLQSEHKHANISENTFPKLV